MTALDPESLTIQCYRCNSLRIDPDVLGALCKVAKIGADELEHPYAPGTNGWHTRRGDLRDALARLDDMLGGK